MSWALWPAMVRRKKLRLVDSLCQLLVMSSHWGILRTLHFPVYLLVICEMIAFCNYTCVTQTVLNTVVNTEAVSTHGNIMLIASSCLHGAVYSPKATIFASE
tara:strand:+ start:643 stop:948 length:306 start_codon:yes stop_codon:yes gene_type:complete